MDLPLGPTAPNMRLKLAGDDRFKGSGVLCASPLSKPGAELPSIGPTPRASRLQAQLPG